MLPFSTVDLVYLVTFINTNITTPKGGALINWRNIHTKERKKTRLLQVDVSSYMCFCSYDGHELKYLIVKSKFLLAEDQF